MVQGRGVVKGRGIGNLIGRGVGGGWHAHEVGGCRYVPYIGRCCDGIRFRRTGRRRKFPYNYCYGQSFRQSFPTTTAAGKLSLQLLLGAKFPYSRFCNYRCRRPCNFCYTSHNC